MSVVNQIYLECALYAALRPTDAVPSHMKGPINFTKIETTPPKQESDILTSNVAGSVGEAAAVVQKATDAAAISLELNTFSSELLELLLNADVVAKSQTGAPVVDAVIDTALDIWTKLPGEYLSSTGISLKTSADAAVASDTYVVDTVAGYIKPTNAAAVGTGMKISFTTSSVTYDQYQAGKAKSAVLYLNGKAYDKYAGKWGNLTIEMASVSNQSAYDWAAGGWMNGGLTGTLVTPAGKNSPITFDRPHFAVG